MNIYNQTQAYLYKWIEISTGKWYIGSRTAKNCHPNDGYLCSSKIVKPLIQTDPSNWTHEILRVCCNPKYIRNLEARVLRRLDAKHDPMSYNMHNGDGMFSYTGITHSIEVRTKISAANKTRIVSYNVGEKHYMYGKSMPAEIRTKISNSHIGKPHSDETKVKIGEGNRGKYVSDQTKARISAAMKGKPSPNKGKPSPNKGIPLPRYTCPQCWKGIGGKTNFNRWHGDNCKFIKLD